MSSKCLLAQATMSPKCFGDVQFVVGIHRFIPTYVYLGPLNAAGVGIGVSGHNIPDAGENCECD